MIDCQPLAILLRGNIPQAIQYRVGFMAVGGAPPPRITERGGYRPGAPPGSIAGPLRAWLSHEERCVIHIRSNQAVYSVLPGNRLVDLVHCEGLDQVRRHRY